MKEMSRRHFLELMGATGWHSASRDSLLGRLAGKG